MSFKEKLLGIIPDHTSFQRHKDLASKSEDGSFISEVEEERSDSSYFKDSQGSDNSDEEQDWSDSDENDKEEDEEASPDNLEDTKESTPPQSADSGKQATVLNNPNLPLMLHRNRRKLKTIVKSHKNNTVFRIVQPYKIKEKLSR